MSERRQRPASAGVPSTDSPARGSKSASSRATSAENLVVGAGIASVFLSILIAVKAITPIFLTAAIVPFFLQMMKRGLHGRSARLTARWAITIFICVVIAAGFVTPRAERAFPYAVNTVDVIEDWVAGTNEATPADFKLLLAGGLVFAAASALTGGVAGLLLASILLASSACGTAYLFQQGDNIFHIMVIAVQPWLLFLIGAGVFLLVPAAHPLLNRFVPTPVPGDKTVLMRLLYTGAGLFVLSILLRLTTAGTWRSLTERWTIS